MTTSISYTERHYDVIVIGVGHAGIEAAMAAGNLGCKTLMIGMNLDTIGQMSCNPAIGGPAKSQLVKEIDALGGVMGICADATYIQMKTLNASKGPAVQALRAQSDKAEYRQFARNLVETHPNISLRQTMATRLIVDEKTKRIISVVDNLGIEYPCGAVVLSNGTFLNGKLFIGEQVVSGGRSGEGAATGITADLVEWGHSTGRLKTGTPPRLDGRSIDTTGLDAHAGDEELTFFSFLPNRPVMPQIACYMTYTNEKTHQLIKDNIHRSPMVQGMIEGTGPRYCPSIEDKIMRFTDKDRHHLFIEPEGRSTYETYLQGFSSSMPIDVQMAMIKTLPGLENAVMMRPACAVEYDYFPAYQCDASLMSKHISGVFMSGQINGTSGYEEAAAQGLIAGINAARFVGNQSPFILPRESSYIGTLIDDLVTKEITEPYRMLTSRSEYRLLLRQDNADVRLTPLGRKLGMVSDRRWQTFETKQATVQQLMTTLAETKVQPEDANVVLETIGSTALSEKTSLEGLLRRPEVGFKHLQQLEPNLLGNISKDIWFYTETELKYQGYIQKQTQSIQRLENAANQRIPKEMDYTKIPQLSNEAKEKLTKIKPDTIAQALRIPGVTPADISIVQILLSQRKSQDQKPAATKDATAG